MAEVGGKLTVIAHVACNNTADSRALAAHAESLGVDAIASIPPIYFHLPDAAVARYWNDISAAAPNTDFIIYNIPQLAGVALSLPLLREMQKNPRLIGVKNSSMPVQDIQMWRDEGVLVFNGPDEQLLSGLAAGACGGIGGTYAAMLEVAVIVISCALPVSRSLAETFTMPLASIENVTSICGTPRGARRMPVSWKRPSSLFWCAMVLFCSNFIEKAGVTSGMAGSSNLLDFCKNGIHAPVPV